MAADGGSRGDFNAHERTYARFITLFKVGTGVSLVVGLLVIFMIAS